MLDQETKAEKQARPNKDEIKGLPAHAQYQFCQGTWYVYFPYCFREDGKRKQERDYIGTLSPDGKKFLPNLYYVQNEPDFEHRPPERWKNPTMRQRALEKLNANKVESIVTDVVLDPEIDSDPDTVKTSVFNPVDQMKTDEEIMEFIINCYDEDPEGIVYVRACKFLCDSRGTIKTFEILHRVTREIAARNP